MWLNLAVERARGDPRVDLCWHKLSRQVTTRGKMVASVKRGTKFYTEEDLLGALIPYCEKTFEKQFGCRWEMLAEFRACKEDVERSEVEAEAYDLMHRLIKALDAYLDCLKKRDLNPSHLSNGYDRARELRQFAVVFPESPRVAQGTAWRAPSAPLQEPCTRFHREHEARLGRISVRSPRRSPRLAVISFLVFRGKDFDFKADYKQRGITLGQAMDRERRKMSQADNRHVRKHKGAT